MLTTTKPHLCFVMHSYSNMFRKDHQKQVHFNMGFFRKYFDQIICVKYKLLVKHIWVMLLLWILCHQYIDQDCLEASISVLHILAIAELWFAALFYFSFY